ncbi:hypothetical protein A0128_08740 [Leptospira tipperaryensis]|uniref:HTH tetR-type domain-containing protein n=1 Tax=Leptospira tipperaryensis TaxID=2564040 RepID=A0A1D7UWF1_9LEPT|nr:TetR/AcrR family transcriptional regulator [Leptospira tipperaryensis]AOP33916.1 hypothetical protein A0128_08740 [Leptospira tipperaryensis]
MKGKNQKEEIITASLDLFRKNGYTPTSMSEIAKTCKLLKGSVYHYFESKEAILDEVLLRVENYFENEIFDTKGKEPASAIIQTNEKILKYFLNHPDGCIFANVSLEAKSLHKSAEKKIRFFFERWTEVYYSNLKFLFSKKKAEQMSQDYVSRIQGSLLMRKIHLKDSILKQTIRLIKEELKNT